MVGAVLGDLQTFWSDALAAGSGPGLRPPAGGYVSMDSTAASGSALCIGDPALIAGNAFYCPQGDGIVFDSSALVPVLAGAYGSGGLAVAFAHEFTHAVQAQVSPTAADRERDPERFPAILIEAQADCGAGAFLAAANSANAGRVHIPDAAMVRAVAPILDFRDPVTLSPADVTAHGLSLDRLTALLVGARGGPTGCLAMAAKDLEPTLGKVPPSAGEVPRFASADDAMAAARPSIIGLSSTLAVTGSEDPSGRAADPADLAAAAPIGQFAAATAEALAVGRALTGTAVGAACFTGQWTASVFGKAGRGELGSWPGDADEGLDLIRSRPGAAFAELAAYADGFHHGFGSCRDH